MCGIPPLNQIVADEDRILGRKVKLTADGKEGTILAFTYNSYNGNCVFMIEADKKFLVLYQHQFELLD
jgi:hypothetical protein